MTDSAGGEIRKSGLRQILTKHRREMVTEVQSRIRDGRTDRPNEVRDELEDSDADVRGGIEFALLQMRVETLARIDAALVRLETGEYGCCFECAEEISERRLRAMPFAVRCQSCEERREQAKERSRQLAHRRGSLSLI